MDMLNLISLAHLALIWAVSPWLPFNRPEIQFKGTDKIVMYKTSKKIKHCQKITIVNNG